jgi:thiol-disulfide isomerase/thioredoxin
VRRLLAAALAATATAGVLAGCGGEENWAKKCTTTNGVVECDVADRPQIGDVTGELLDGTKYDIAGERGKVVVVNFWGSWCAPCRAEAPDLEKTYQATKAKNVAFLGINSRDDRDSAKAFERGRVTYPSIYDFDGDVALKFDITQTTTPATLILDRQGRIAIGLRRSTTAGELQPLVERVAAEGNG